MTAASGFLYHIFDFSAFSSLMNQKIPKKKKKTNKNKKTSKTLALRLDYSADNPPEGTLNVLVSQDIDKKVQHRSDQCTSPRPLHPSWRKMRQLS